MDDHPAHGIEVRHGQCQSPRACVHPASVASQGATTSAKVRAVVNNPQQWPWPVPKHPEPGHGSPGLAFDGQEAGELRMSRHGF